MTEQEWLECSDSKRMLDFLRGKVSERKLVLFACACCRRVWNILTDERSRNGVVVRELYEDGVVTTYEVEAAADAARRARADIRRSFRMAYGDREDCPEVAPAYAAGAASNTASGNYHPVSWFVTRAAACVSSQGAVRAERAESKVLTSLLRDIVGPSPFRPVAANPLWLAWSEGTVVKLAQAIYDERSFDRLPILADALEEAGCDDADILDHCRQQHEHVRGCWVVDLILGKE